MSRSTSSRSTHPRRFSTSSQQTQNTRRWSSQTCPGPRAPGALACRSQPVLSSCRTPSARQPDVSHIHELREHTPRRFSTSSQQTEHPALEQPDVSQSTSSGSTHPSGSRPVLSRRRTPGAQQPDTSYNHELREPRNPKEQSKGRHRLNNVSLTVSKLLYYTSEHEPHAQRVSSRDVSAHAYSS